MSFNMPLFYLVFLPAALLGFQLLGYLGRRWAIGFLTFMSLLFYFQWNHVFVLLLIGSIAVNFAFSELIAFSAKRPQAQSFWLIAGITTNLGVLCYYKYLFPMLRFLNARGVVHHDWGTVILPLGISFFTFTQIAYLIDLKQGIAQRESPLSYALFVTFFPHLVAGPIIHHKEMMPQFRRPGRYQLNRADLTVGLTWFTMGMFKKVMVADRIAPFAEAFFGSPHGMDAATAWRGVLLYSLQLYFDFSGYSDMAVGLARMFSIRFPLNFNSPYKADNIIDFWQRWHMTLTRYILDYVYAPIQLQVSSRRLDKGKKLSKKAQRTLEGFTQMVAMPTVITMFLAGVWHGAGLQFLCFGLLHGAYLTVNHAWRIFVPAESRLRKLMTVPVGMGLTYAGVVVAQVFFRANSLGDVFTVLGEMVGRNGWGHRWPLSHVLLVAALFAVCWLMPNTQEILGENREGDIANWRLFPTLRWVPTVGWWAATSGAFALSMFYSTASSTFLYFQF
jgi:alginate O-acetyltransferase complex protein AlgI